MEPTSQRVGADRRRSEGARAVPSESCRPGFSLSSEGPSGATLRLVRVPCAMPPRTPPQGALEKISDALVPPNPKEFDSANRTVRSFETCGTRSMSQPVDGSSRLRVGGTTC